MPLRKNLRTGQAALEYFILLAVIGVLTLIIGNYFLGQTRQSSQNLFSNAANRIVNADSEISIQGHNFSITELLSALNRNTILGGVTEERLRNSIARSNENGDVVKKAYTILTENKILPDGTFIPVLFLEGLDNPNLALALADLGVLVIGYDAFKNIPTDNEQQTEWVAIKIPHEAIHVIQHKDNPNMAIITEEHLAYKATYDVVALFYGKDSNIAKTQEQVYLAFGVLANNPRVVTDIFGVKEEMFKNINYKEITIQEEYVVIGLYNMQGGEERYVGVDPETGQITPLILK